MLQNGLVLSPKDVLKNKEETMWRGRFVGNAGDEFCGMNKTKLLGMMPYRRDSIVVIDFWEVEYPEGGTDDGEDGGSGGEEDSDDVEEGDNVIVGENSVEAERSDGKDDPVSSPED